MKPYTKQDNVGRSIGGHDIHHKTADQPRTAAKKAAKPARHGARQDAQRTIFTELQSTTII
jgi:hypothetical protein